MTEVIKGTVQIRVQVGMEVRVKEDLIEGKKYFGRRFTIDSEPRDLCGTEVVALKDSITGERFSAAYDLSMLEVTDPRTGSKDD